MYAFLSFTLKKVSAILIVMGAPNSLRKLLRASRISVTTVLSIPGSVVSVVSVVADAAVVALNSLDSIQLGLELIFVRILD